MHPYIYTSIYIYMYMYRSRSVSRAVSAKRSRNDTGIMNADQQAKATSLAKLAQRPLIRGVCMHVNYIYIYIYV